MELAGEPADRGLVGPVGDEDVDGGVSGALGNLALEGLTLVSTAAGRAR